MAPAFAAIAPVHSGDDENRTGLWLTMVEAVHEKSGKGGRHAGIRLSSRGLVISRKRPFLGGQIGTDPIAF
jgi:hypothetical protein